LYRALGFCEGKGADGGGVETAILERPEQGWGELYLNAAPGAGTVQVELRDPATETALSGWARAGCDAVTDSVRRRASATRSRPSPGPTAIRRAARRKPGRCR
jgi:hypothetical protein